MTNDKLTSKLACWSLILQEYEFKVIHQPGITHQNVDTMSRRPRTTSEDFSKAKQDFDQISIIHVFYASSYLALLQCNLGEHPIVDIWEDLENFEVFSAWGIPSPSYIKSSGSHTTVIQTIFMEGQSPRLMFTISDRVVPPPHERPSLIQKVHLEFGHFGVKRTYNLFVPHYHWRGMYVQVQDVIARCEQCDRVRIYFSF
jgi:hypothetical protein